MVYKMTASDDSQSTASNSIDASIITMIEDNSSQEVASTSSYTSVTALSDDIVNSHSHTPIKISRTLSNTTSGARHWTHY